MLFCFPYPVTASQEEVEQPKREGASRPPGGARHREST
jgi:hypothetical protein